MGWAQRTSVSFAFARARKRAEAARFCSLRRLPVTTTLSFALDATTALPRNCTAYGVSDGAYALEAQVRTPRCTTLRQDIAPLDTRGRRSVCHPRARPGEAAHAFSAKCWGERVGQCLTRGLGPGLGHGQLELDVRLLGVVVHAVEALVVVLTCRGADSPTRDWRGLRAR